MRTALGIVLIIVEDIVMWVFEKCFGDNFDKEIELINEELRKQAEGL